MIDTDGAGSQTVANGHPSAPLAVTKEMAFPESK
jgi:hypothetical protein